MLAPSPNQNQPLPQGREPAEAFQSGCFPDRSHLQEAFGGAWWGLEFRGSPLPRGNVPRSWAALKPCGQRGGDNGVASPSPCPCLERGARARRVCVTPLPRHFPAASWVRGIFRCFQPPSALSLSHKFAQPLLEAA